MAGKFWWQKVPNPDGIAQAAARPVSDARVRYSTALRWAGVFKDEPDIVRGLVNNDVPLSLALRSFDSYATSKQAAITKQVSDAGFGTQQQPNVAADEASRAEQARKMVSDAERGVKGSGLWGALSSGVTAIGGAFKWTGEHLMAGLSDVVEGLQTPLRAGYASDTSADVATNTVAKGGGLFGAGASLLGGLANYGEGVYRLASGDLTGPQREDVARGGGNPDSFGSRVSYYFQDYGEKRSPVSDTDVAWLKGLGRYAPGDVDAAREIVTSGALDDMQRAMPSLSASAQGLLGRLDTDKSAAELLRAMADTSQTSFGGRLVRNANPGADPDEWFGPGSLSRGIAGGVAEMIATWHLDPLVGASKGIGAVRNARWAVGHNSSDRIAHTVQMLKASDDEFKPQGALANRFHDAMSTAENIVLAQEKSVDPALGAVEAAKLRQSWLRRYPGYGKTLDTLVGMRTGAVGALRARNEVEAAADAKAAASQGRSIQPWVIDMSGDGSPLWQFTDAEGHALSAEDKAVQRANVADHLADFIVADAVSSGREMTGSRLLLPGQVSASGKIRDVIAPVLEAFTRRDASVLKQLRAVGTKPIPLGGHLAAGENGLWDTLVSPESADWYRDNYTFGLTHALARGWRNFEKTFSDAVINPASPDSVQTYQRLVSQFMPKRQAQMISTMYAGANPAERWAMVRQTLGSFLNVMNLRNTPQAQQLVERMSKGLVSTDDAINGYRAGGLEYYTTPDNNMIRVGDLKMPAAVHPWQVSEGVQLPNWREVRQLANRNWLVNLVHRTADGATANGLVRAWKSSKVTTWANMQRQALEGFAFTAWRDPKALGEYRNARKAVKSAVLTGRADVNDIKRLIATTNGFNAVDLAELEKLRRTHPETFVSSVRDMLARNGHDAGAADVLARMGSDVDVAEFWASLNMRGPIRPAWLGAMGPWDVLRRVRARGLERRGGTVSDSPLAKHLDDELVHDIIQAQAKQLGAAADSYAWNAAEATHNVNRELVVDAARNGISMRPTKVRNAYDWLGDQGDVTATLWASELGRRLADEPGKLVAQLLAHQHASGTHGAITQPVVDIADHLGVHPSRVTTPDELMTYLYAEHELGNNLRTNGARLQYLPDGSRAVSEADRALAAEHAAQAAVDDLVHHLGGRVSRPAGATPRFTFPDELSPVLEKVARGEEIATGDLSKIEERFRPEGMVTPIYAPIVPTGKGRFQGLANLSSRAYETVVAKPLENLFLLPAFVAHRRLAYREVEPLMEEMVRRGIPTGQAAYLAEAMVNNRALARVFHATDNPAEKNVFAEMGDKWMMFQRANQDFLRRLLGATAASPEGIARANIMLNAGVHTGIIHAEPVPDEEGNTEQRLTFVYPGTALAQRVMADAGMALGLYPDELARVPQFDGFKSQVRFLNPGVSNPLSFSANPIFGLALSGMEKLWPSATVDLERLKRAAQGGADFEGTEGPTALKNLMPSMFSRFVPLMQKGDADGQFQSAMRAAMMYAEVNGQAPGADASPSERARFLDGIKATATNILMQRAIFGAFMPASPQLEDPHDIEMDTLGRLEGLPNLRSEFFSIRGDLAKKYPDNYIRANSEAIAEFARRYPGELISNPAAFSVGSTKVAGVDQGYVPYTIEATRWLMANLDFVRANPQMAIALMPKSTTDGDFSNEAYKLQLKSDIRTHKDLSDFYDDLTLSDDIGEYYKTRSAYFAAAKSDPAFSKSVYAKMDDWENGWRRTHPLASAELDRRADPNFVFAEVAPSLDRILKGSDPLPASMQGLRPQIQQMYDDYQKYRARFMDVSYYDNDGRANANKAYQQAGDVKWLQTPLADLWDLMRVTEGR